MLDFNKEVYQEIKVSTLRNVIYSEDLDNERMLAYGDIEEVDEVSEEDDEGKGVEEEEDETEDDDDDIDDDDDDD